MDTMTIIGVVCVLIGFRIIQLLQDDKPMRPTDEQIADAFTRRSCHLKAVNGKQRSMDELLESPYMRIPGRGQAWYWDEDMMRVDCVILADMYVEEHSDAEERH